MGGKTRERGLGGWSWLAGWLAAVENVRTNELHFFLLLLLLDSPSSLSYRLAFGLVTVPRRRFFTTSWIDRPVCSVQDEDSRGADDGGGDGRGGDGRQGGQDDGGKFVTY